MPHGSRSTSARKAFQHCLFALLDGISEQLSGVLVPILFLLFFWASSFACSLSFPSLFYTAVSQLWDFCVPPESRPLIFVLSSPGDVCVAHTAHFSCLRSRHVVHRPGLAQSWCSRYALCKGVSVAFLDSPSSEFFEPDILMVTDKEMIRDAGPGFG